MILLEITISTLLRASSYFTTMQDFTNIYLQQSAPARNKHKQYIILDCSLIPYKHIGMTLPYRVGEVNIYTQGDNWSHTGLVTAKKKHINNNTPPWALLFRLTLRHPS
jgi:hypothetical protein